MSLVAAYNFGESSGPVLDLSGNGRDFALNGNMARTTGAASPVGAALTQTSSSTGYGPAPGFALTNHRTVMMWIQSTAQVADGRIFEHVSSADGNSIWEFPLMRDANWFLQGFQGATLRRFAFARPTDGQWHHIAGTYDGAVMRAYMDGVQVGSMSFTGTLRTDASELIFMRSAGSAVTKVAAFRVYDEALNQTAIQTLMNQPVEVAPVVGASGAKIWNGSAWVDSAPMQIRGPSGWLESPGKMYL